MALFQKKTPSVMSDAYECYLDPRATKPFFGDFFFDVYHYYGPFHGYLSLLICIFGVVVNLITIIILLK